MMPTDLLRSLDLRSNGFRSEPDMAAKVLRLGYRIYEVPIACMGRTYEEGKKINESDGSRAMSTLLRFRCRQGTIPRLQPIEACAAAGALALIREHAAASGAAPALDGWATVHPRQGALP